MSTSHLLIVLAFLALQIYTQNPCAAVSEVYRNATDDYRVPAELAYACLNDVKFDSEAAGPWLNSLEPYMQWQTTTAYLKNPPEGYLMPAVDVWARFSEIRERAKMTDGYANEYEFELDLYNLFQSTHDGHFRYLPNMLGGIFAFGRPISLTSFSVDGFQKPKIYVYSDVLAYFVNGTARSISAVKEINGQQASEYVEQWSMHGSLQDPDALYNNVLYSLASASLGTSGSGPGTFAGAGRGRLVYPGPNTTISFENGTTAVFENFAECLSSFSKIDSGADLYNYTINPPYGFDGSQFDRIKTTKPVQTARPLKAPPGYPTPIAQQFSNYVGGYYLDRPGYEDIAVLTVPSFIGTCDYQDVAYSFLEKAKQDGKRRLIVDLSANGGGTIMQGYNLFLNLFPEVLPYGATRYRSHEAFDIVGETVSQRMFYYPFDYKHPPNLIWQDFSGGLPFNYRADVDVNYENFESWRDKNPLDNIFAEDYFTSIIRWNLSDPTIYPSNAITPNGFDNRTGMPPARPFEPEDIVLLYDGYCASTCAIFSEMMTQQVGGIRTVSIGGRPNNKPMQTIGGTKGTNNWGFYWIHTMVWRTYQLALDQWGYFNSTILHAYRNSTNLISYHRGDWYSAGLNVRDGIRQGDETQTPLQFVYEAADCRLYPTAEMTVDIATLWEKVVDVAWDGDRCVVGGFQSERPHTKRSPAATQAVRLARRKALRRRMIMSASRIAAIERTLDVRHNDLTPEPGLMLP